MGSGGGRLVSLCRVFVLLDVMNLSEQERKDYEQYLDKLHFHASIAQTIKFENEQKTREDERNKTQTEIVRNSLQKGLSVALIPEITGLNQATILQIQKEIN